MPTMHTHARFIARRNAVDQANSLRVRLVPLDPGPPPRSTAVEVDSQCDCGRGFDFAVEGTEMPILDLPLSFYLELTPLCNNRCPNCGNVFVERLDATWSLPPLSASEWSRILAKVAPHAYRLKITGGEPTLHPEFEDIMAEIDRLGVSFTLFTNARWHDPDRLCHLFQHLDGLDGLLVSLHGPEAPTHEAFTQVAGSFAETEANIRRAVAAGLPVSLSCIITRLNWDRVHDMLHQAYRLGAQSVVFNRHLGADAERLAAAPDELQVAIEVISALRASGAPVKLGNCVPQCFAPTGQAGCLAGLAFLTIDPWGRARPCNHATVICGDLRRQSLADVWNSPNLAAWRDFYPEPCRRCVAFATCRGGCKAQALASGQDIDPLAGTWNQPTIPRQRRLVFYEQARPIGCFERKPQRHGMLLLRGNRLAMLAHHTQPILDMLDGESTLQQIEQQHGMAGLELIADLYEQQLIELA